MNEISIQVVILMASLAPLPIFGISNTAERLDHQGRTHGRSVGVLVEPCVCTCESRADAPCVAGGAR